MENPNSSAILTAAAALFDAPGTHCRGAYARDSKGTPVGPTNQTACSWCVVGAITRAAHDLGADAFWDGPAIQDAIDAMHRSDQCRPYILRRTVQQHHTLERWSDAIETTHEDVRRALLDVAAKI